MREILFRGKRLIDANALKIHRMHNAGANHPLDVAYRKDIDNAPTVDAVEVVHGCWVLTVHEEQCNFRWNVTAECSECQHSKGEIYAGHFSGFPKELVESIIPIYAKKVKLDNYCPNCGAKMDGERKDNE